MGFQSSRLWFRNKDHKDIYFKGKYHDKMYIGGTLVWEKLRGAAPDGLDGWWCLYSGGGFLFLASGESLKTGSKKILQRKNGAWEYLTSTPDCTGLTTPALRFYGATPAIIDNGFCPIGGTLADRIKLFRNGAWESPFGVDGTSYRYSGEAGKGKYIFDRFDTYYPQTPLDAFCADDGAHAVILGTSGRAVYMAALDAEGGSRAVKLNPANNTVDGTEDSLAEHYARQVLEAWNPTYRYGNDEFYRRFYGLVSAGGRLFASVYYNNDDGLASELSSKYMAEYSVSEEFDTLSGRRHLYFRQVQQISSYYVPLMLEVDGDLLYCWRADKYAGSYTYQFVRLNLDTMKRTYLNFVQVPAEDVLQHWIERFGFNANAFMYANGTFYLLEYTVYQTSQDLTTWEIHSYPEKIKEYGMSGRVIDGKVCGRYLDNDGKYHFGPLGV